MVQLIVYALLLSSNGNAAEMSRPMSEMHGDCSNYKLNVKTALAAWEMPATSVTAKTAIPFSKRASLQLTERAAVQFIQKPEKEFTAGGKEFGGLFTFRTGKEKSLSVAAGSKVWFDVVDNATKKIVPAQEFEMQTGCDKVLKFVKYTVTPNTEYTLQVSSSKNPQADFAIIQE